MASHFLYSTEPRVVAFERHVGEPVFRPRYDAVDVPHQHSQNLMSGVNAEVEQGHES